MPNFCGRHWWFPAKNAVDKVPMVARASSQANLEIVWDRVVDAHVLPRLNFRREDLSVGC